MMDAGEKDESIQLQHQPPLLQHQQPHADRHVEPLSSLLARWPKATFFIIGNEFCERFSFYGMRSILLIYLTSYLGFSAKGAISAFHGFVIVAYLTPLFGSILADGFIGKFWTIFSLSIVYTLGQATLSAAAAINADSFLHPGLDFLALLVIGIGTGGIKPCVSAFGGDQFDQSETRMISLFFSIFYFSINAGSTISMALTPIFRNQPCMGRQSCFPLAFGVPALLMLTALVLFLIGSKWYKRQPLSENIIGKVSSTLYRAMVASWSSNEKREHWVDHALDGHSCPSTHSCSPDHCSQRQFVEELKRFLRVAMMMTSFPMFWALYDQQGSRWTIQAFQMDAHVMGSFYLLPDQMQVLNAILILLFIPLFQIVVYPTVEKMGIRTTSLRRMAAGGILAALSFVVCAMVQTSIDASHPQPPQGNQAQVTFINAFPPANGSECTFTISGIGSDEAVIKANESSGALYVDVDGGGGVSVSGRGSNCSMDTPLSLSLVHHKYYYVLLTPHGYVVSEFNSKRVDKSPQFGLSIIALNSNSTDLALCASENVCDPSQEPAPYFFGRSSSHELELIPFDSSAPAKNVILYTRQNLQSGKYSFFHANGNSFKPVGMSSLEITDTSGVYIATVGDSRELFVHSLVAPARISILWQLPQYIILTAAEVLFSITGLEFAYSEAGPSLKSVVQALSLLTVACGDLIIFIVNSLDLFGTNLARSHRPSYPLPPLQVAEMLSFAAAELVVIAIFIWLSVYHFHYAHSD